MLEPVRSVEVEVRGGRDIEGDSDMSSLAEADREEELGSQAAEAYRSRLLVGMKSKPRRRRGCVRPWGVRRL